MSSEGGGGGSFDEDALRYIIEATVTLQKIDPLATYFYGQKVRHLKGIMT